MDDVEDEESDSGEVIGDLILRYRMNAHLARDCIGRIE